MAPERAQFSEANKPQTKKFGRLFLLLFWCYSDKSEIASKLDFFFKNIYLPGDRVILSGGTQHFEINELEQKTSVLDAFVNHWQEQKADFNRELRSTYNDLNNAQKDCIDTIAMTNFKLPNAKQIVMAALSIAKTLYRSSLTEWQISTNRINSADLKKMAKTLEQINANKWALVFYEKDNRPLLDEQRVEEEIVGATRGMFAEEVAKYVRDIKDIRIQAQANSSFLSAVRAIRDQFAQSGTIFHLLQMSQRFSKQYLQDAATNSSYVQLEPVFSNWDAVFQTTSKVSGGQIVDMDQGLDVLERLSQTKDISYTLTYIPREKKSTKRKIELKIINPELKQWQKYLLYGRMLEMASIPTLKVGKISSDQDRLHITLDSFYPVNTANGSQGHFSVSIAAEKSGTPAQVLFQQDMESNGTFDLPLGIKAPGDWTLWVRVLDLMSGQSVLEKHSLIIPKEKEITADSLKQSEPQTDELNAILFKAAAYCDRLQKSALRFTCIEDISEQIRKRKKLSPRQDFDMNHWKYDYQIVIDTGKLSENRLLMKKNRKKFSPPVQASLETFYESQFSFFMPVTMLAAERQASYRYAVTGQDKIKKRAMNIVTASPKDKSSYLPGGRIWIDVEDGSVWKIELDPLTLPSFRKRYHVAKSQGVQLNMTDVHEYYKRHNDMQFPSKTVITESQTYLNIYDEKTEKSLDNASTWTTTQKAPPMQLDILKVNYQYDKYRFFDIHTQAIIKELDVEHKDEAHGGRCVRLAM